MKPWHGIIRPEEEEIYRKAGFARRVEVGKRPALLIIDVQYRTAGSTPKPLPEALEEYRTSCGQAAWDAIGHLTILLREFPERRLPVIYPYVAPKQSYDVGRLSEKTPGLMSVPAAGYDFVAEVAPRPEDILIPKRHPSAFFGTPLVSYLVNLQVDTLFVTGCTTSGCVHSTVIDAFSYNFRVIVPQECVYDRSPTSHAVNLFDMAAKYADVVPVSEAIDILRRMHRETRVGRAST